MSEKMQGNSYVRLVRENKTYRKFWLAAFISMFGEWFNTIALFLIILQYTESELLLGVLMAVRMGCFALMQPFFGLLADRLNRKKLMIATNVLQIFLALAFIAIDGPEDMWWMFLCSGFMMALHGLYVTAERAALPNIVSKEDLTTANALDSATWSTALCLGAFAGGLVVSEFGVTVAFIIDSVTFLIGTILLIPLVVPQTYDKPSTGSILSSSIKDIWLGQKRIKSDPRLFRIIFAKTSWNIAGGGLAGVFLVLAGNDIEFVGAALGFGIYFFARGIGTGIGPILARRFFKNSEKWPRLIGLLIIVSGFFYLLVGLSLNGPLIITLVLVTLAHTASGGNWVLSTVLTQQWVEDEMRGRVFSTDMLMLSLGQVISTISAGYLIEHGYVNLQQGILLFSCIMLFSGFIFTIWNPKNKVHAHKLGA
ncbi:MAG: MFS transporter [Candidatus Thermoplasmatota archaeon]|nr:MFS transporter [Candidatus Thermoplasmatota archaeon]